jgi:hypothetical protein
MHYQSLIPAQIKVPADKPKNEDTYYEEFGRDYFSGVRRLITFVRGAFRRVVNMRSAAKRQNGAKHARLT